jgi:SAM-dependent methyltransferase
MGNEQSAVTLQEYMQDLEKDLNELISDPAVSGYTSIEEQDIVYGITLSVGVNPATDSILDIGCGIGELYYYTERFTGTRPHKYYGIDNDERLLDINKFRSGQDDSVSLMELDIFNLQENYSMYSEDVLRNLNILGNEVRLDWAIMSNMVTEEHTANQIADMIGFWSKVATKGAAFTFRVYNHSTVNELISMLMLNNAINTKLIIRSDFIKKWISIYIYNQRD